ncbi:MAG: HD domain-containing protein [Chthoniobacteraceae bacterium]
MDAPHSPAPSTDRLEQQLRFLAEIDKLKNVLRRGLVTDTLRPENSAEHSWHLAMLVLTLGGHATAPQPDLLHVLKLVLIHDLVEIDAGDTFYYDVEGNASKAAREQQAADRIFPLLPDDQARELRALWNEFEAGLTGEAKLAQALDRLQAVLQNLNTGCATWRKLGVTKAQILERNQKIGIILPGIWKEVRRKIDQAEEQGHFK